MYVKLLPIALQQHVTIIQMSKCESTIIFSAPVNILSVLSTWLLTYDLDEVAKRMLWLAILCHYFNLTHFESLSPQSHQCCVHMSIFLPLVCVYALYLSCFQPNIRDCSSFVLFSVTIHAAAYQK